MTLEELKSIPARNGVVFLTDRSPNLRNDLYIKVRTIEGRLLDDCAVSRLPVLPHDHPLNREWERRRNSSARLLKYLKKKKAGLTVLDVGCGNGWMSNFLSQIPGSHVFALDLNVPEMEQGARVFSKNSALTFLYADIFEAPLPESAFDIIAVAGAIQYFPDLRILIERLLQLLKPKGEIHIFDSPLYADSSVAAARSRSRAYYEKIGVPEMADLYFHHTYASLKDHHYAFLSKPNSIKNIILKNSSPFPWIRICK